MKKYALLLAALPLVLLAACTPKPPAPTPGPTPTPDPVVTATPIPSGPVWQDQVFEKEYENKDGVQLLTVRFVMPGIAGAATVPAWSAIHEYYKAEGDGYLLTAGETADLAEGDYEVQSSLGYDFSPYAMEAYYSVTCQSPSVISIRRAYYSNVGTAYPANFQFSEQFDARDGSLLTFADVFADPDAAKAKIFDAIRTQITKREDAGVFDAAKVETAFRESNFYLTQDSVVFYYQPDDLAPHAAGIPEFPITRADLEELLIQ